MPDGDLRPSGALSLHRAGGRADAQLDTNGKMEQSIARIEYWVVTHAENQGLRVDTHNGLPDITFVRLPHSDAQAASKYSPNFVIGEDLVAAGFNDPAKVYAAFYDGHGFSACGGAKSPALPKVGAMYLQAQPTNQPPCRNPLSSEPGLDRPGYFEIGLLHEIMHAIGFTPLCAPHSSKSAFSNHVNDSRTDLMYGPTRRMPSTGTGTTPFSISTTTITTGRTFLAVQICRTSLSSGPAPPRAQPHSACSRAACDRRAARRR
jgi:hypothetical protein